MEDHPLADAAPAISILLPVFNGADFLRELIASFQEQTFRDFGLLVYDDASSDGSLDLAAGDARIFVYQFGHRLFNDVLRLNKEISWMAARHLFTGYGLDADQHLVEDSSSGDAGPQFQVSQRRLEATIGRRPQKTITDIVAEMITALQSETA